MITRRCTACLDDERCWVCLGTGLIDSRGGEPGPCHRCYASGACASCQTITIEDVGQSPILNPFRRWRAAHTSAAPAFARRTRTVTEA